MFTIKSSGSFKNMDSFLGRLRKAYLFRELHKYGIRGMDALSNATPRDSGQTAEGWRYKIVERRGFISLEWYNINIVNGANIAVLIQYGHGTGTGGYVQGRDYINPAIRPVFDEIANDIWKKVTG